jgi:hypothetical protein
VQKKKAKKKKKEEEWGRGGQRNRKIELLQPGF